MYIPETLHENDDDGTIVESAKRLHDEVVGHKIIRVEDSGANFDNITEITLDNGKKVIMEGTSDCCAYSYVKSFLLHPESVDHIITGVRTTEDATVWHVFADMGDILKLSVDWSCGNPFYYGYGFDILVRSPGHGA